MASVHYCIQIVPGCNVIDGGLFSYKHFVNDVEYNQDESMAKGRTRLYVTISEIPFNSI